MGGVGPVSPPQPAGPRGGREGTVPYKPRLLGLSRPHPLSCTRGGEGSPGVSGTCGHNFWSSPTLFPIFLQAPAPQDFAPQAAKGSTLRGHLHPGEGDSPPVHSRCSGVRDPGGCCCWPSCAWGQQCAAPKPGRAGGRLSKSCSLSPRWLSVKASVSTESLAESSGLQGWVSPRRPLKLKLKVLRACVAGRARMSVRFLERSQLWTQKA